MITVKLSGGLGNQFFQYSAALALRSIRGKSEKITIEYQSKTHHSHAERQLTLSKFLIDNMDCVEYSERCFFDVHNIRYAFYKILGKVASFVGEKDYNGEKYISSLEWIICNFFGVYSQKFNRFYPFYKSFLKNVYVTGMFHNADYFENIKDDLKEIFVLNEEFYDDKMKRRLEEIKCAQAVCVHVRRGDYLNVDGYAICSNEYFSKGINHIRNNLENPVFFIFSDDIEWCKHNIQGEDIVYLDDNNPDYIDFSLMSSCKHFITSNSTFSWWAAYLGDEQDKIVITPNYWSKSAPREWLVLDGWIGIEPN